jgi:hypothetical protein
LIYAGVAVNCLKEKDNQFTAPLSPEFIPGCRKPRSLPASQNTKYRMTISDYKEGKVIVLSKAFDTRSKVLNIVYFFVFTFAAVMFLGMAVSERYLSAELVLFTVVVVGVYLLAGYRFISKALQTEKVIVEKGSLTLLKSGFLSKDKKSYDSARIHNFRHLGKPDTTAHPLAGQSFDYLGFQTEQQVINELHGDQRIAFDYDGRTVKFGENIYSWEFDEISRTVFVILERDVTIKVVSDMKI